MEDMEIQTIYIGGWFQRTTLHLTEIWNLLNEGKFDPYLSGESEDAKSMGVARKAVSALHVKELTREIGPLEFILFTSKEGVTCRIYEDGLIVLEKPYTNFTKDIVDIKDYFENKLSNAFSILFAKGAPVPKELAGIKSIFPFIITVENAGEKDVEKIFSTFKYTKHSVVSSNKIDVYRGHEIVVINNAPKRLARGIIEAEIFFREFKTQLHKYLGIHRQLWENIAKIKEQPKITGSQTERYRNQLADYQKTINLIDARIDQMGAYVRTRQKVASAQKIDTYLDGLLVYKFETLLDTHEYIRYLWDMTQNYLNATIVIFDGIQEKATQTSVSTLQLVMLFTAVNVMLLSLEKQESILSIQRTGVMYAIVVIATAFCLQKIISLIAKKQSFRLKSEKLTQFD